MSAFVPFLLASLLTAQELDGIAAIRVEGAGGEVPSPGASATGEPQSLASVTMEATPSVTGLLSFRHARLTLGYLPRIYYRIGLEQGDESLDPLLLHRVTLTYAHAISRELDLSLTASFSKGDLDYVLASGGGGGAADDLLGGGGFGEPVETPVIDPVGIEDNIINVTTVSGAASVTKTFGPGERLVFEVRPTYTKPRATLVDTTQLRTSGDLTYTKPLDSRNELQLVLGGDASTFESRGVDMTATATTTSIYGVRTSGRFTHTFNSHVSAYVLAGLSVGLTPASEEGGSSSTAVLPLAGLGVSWDIYRRGDWHFAIDASAGVDSFSSPLLGTFDGRLVSTIAVLMEIGARIDIRPSVSFFTTFTEPETDTTTMPMMMPTTSNVVESVLSARLPVSYRFDDDLSLEVGVRTSLRGPRLRGAEEFSLGQPELVGYASISATIDTNVPRFGL